MEEKTVHTIDAKGRSLGRVASEAAHLLLAKDTVTFVKHTAAPVSVTIENASKMIIREPKKDQKEYIRYSGYPGGLKSMTLRELIEKKGHAEALRKAVKGMLPKNKLQSVRMKNLIINT